MSRSSVGFVVFSSQRACLITSEDLEYSAQVVLTTFMILLFVIASHSPSPQSVTLN